MRWYIERKLNRMVEKATFENGFIKNENVRFYNYLESLKKKGYKILTREEFQNEIITNSTEYLLLKEKGRKLIKLKDYEEAATIKSEMKKWNKLIDQSDENLKIRWSYSYYSIYNFCTIRLVFKT